MRTRTKSIRDAITERYHLSTAGIALLLILTSGIRVSLGGCTAAVATGSAVADGRPIVWRNFDWSGNVTLLHCGEGRYAYLSPSPKVPSHGAGTNEAGLAMYTTLMTGMNPKGVRHRAMPAMSWLLANCRTVDEVREAIREQIRFEKGEPGGVRHWDTTKEAPALGVVACDAYGHAAIIEFGKFSSYEYDLNNRTRLQSHPLQIGVRANSPHKRTDHLDNARGGGGRFTTARDNLTRLASDRDKLTVDEVINGVARFGEPGFASSRICNSRTIASTIVWGVKPGEDPRLTTVLTALGNPDYSIYLPAWPAASDSLNSRLTSQESDGIAWQVRQLLEKRDAEDDDEFIQGHFKSFETHLLEVTRSVRAHWLVDGFDKTMAQRLSNEAGETVWRIIRSLNAGTGRKMNAMPEFTALKLEPAGTGLKASCSARDRDGQITGVLWDLGDGTTGRGQEVHHKYSKPGMYLVSCSIDDNDSSRNTRWSLYQAGGP